MVATGRRGCRFAAEEQWVRQLRPRITGSGAQGRCV